MVRLQQRLLLALVLTGIGAASVWWVIDSAAQRRISELEAQQAELEAEVVAFEAMIDRLGRARRLGQIEVLDQVTDPATSEVLSTTVEFVELDDDGRAIGTQVATLPGDVIHVDTQTIRFPTDDVASGHPLRGATLVLLRRMYSDCIAPIDGVPLDVPGAVPPGYASEDGSHGAWAQGLWGSFWRLASDPAFAAAAGVRVAQGEAVYQQMSPGQVWQLDVDAAGGVTLMATVP
ncbi:MAG: hypothetical protein MK074_01955 [Phycisphaerales bacterium]|nr:hypothetical protein [Phycisphaerales bacterium]